MRVELCKRPDEYNVRVAPYPRGVSLEEHGSKVVHLSWVTVEALAEDLRDALAKRAEWHETQNQGYKIHEGAQRHTRTAR